MPEIFAQLPRDQIDALVQYLTGGEGRTAPHDDDDGRSRAHRSPGRGRPRPAADRLAPADRARPAARRLDDAALRGGRLQGLVVGLRAIAGWDPLLEWTVIIVVAFLTSGADRLPRRHRLVRLGVLRLGAPDPPRGPLEPRRPQLARLLPRQHGPQGHRCPIRRHDLRVLHRRWPAGDARTRGACPARRTSSPIRRSTTRSSPSTRR